MKLLNNAMKCVDWIMLCRYVKTTDGSELTFETGSVLFQDNVVDSPADKAPQHYSGVAENVTCMQMIVQLNRTGQVDNPCPF